MTYCWGSPYFHIDISSIYQWFNPVITFGRMGRRGHHPTKDCHANHSRTRVSVPCSPTTNFLLQTKTQKDTSHFGAGGWGAEATILLKIAMQTIVEQGSPCPVLQQHTFYFQIKTQKDSSQFGVGGWGAEATILLYAEATILLLWPYSTKKAYTKMA